MFKNIHLIHRSGKTLYSKNFSDEKLDQSFALVFASSISNFCKTLLKEEVRDVSTTKGRIFLKEVGEFIILCHCDFTLTVGLATIVLNSLVHLLELLFGPCINWDGEGHIFDVSGSYVN